MLTIEQLIAQVEKAAEVFWNFDHPEDKETAVALEEVIVILKNEV